MVAPFKRTTRIAHMIDPQRGRVPVFVFVSWDGAKLSLSGVEGPKANGDAVGSCGQIDMHAWDGYEPEPGIDLAKLRETWRAWHLNDMRAGCSHQMAQGWGDGDPIEVITYKLNREGLSASHDIIRNAEKRLRLGETVTLSERERALANLPYSTTHAPDADSVGSGLYEVDKRENRSPCHVRADEHPRGLLCKPCPVCGYKYGSAWLKEDVPANVLEWLQSLPDNAGACPTRWLRDG